jgi:predicted TIM-barrel fold metal-dependent hydrolase
MSMVVDSHTHIFEKWSGACGLPSRELHWRYIHKTVTRPAAKVYRFADGAEGDASVLFRPGDNTWTGLRSDVSFRVGPYGRLEYTVDGEDWYVQYMPAGMAEIESTPEFLITQMNAAGVDHCVLQAGFTYGYMNDYNALAQRQFPQRFTGLAHVDEPMADTEYWMSETRRAIEQLGLRGLYYQLDGFSRYGFESWFDEPRYAPFWEQLESLGVPVFIEFSAIPNYDRASYLGVLHRFAGLLDRHRGIRWLLVMSPPVQHFARDGRFEFSEEAERVYRHDSTLLEICFPITWGGTWDYPYPEAQSLIRDLRDKLGAGKLVWGSDMPNVERFCTYRQCVDYVRRHCGFLGEDEMDRILGGNVVELTGNTPTADERRSQ